MNDHCLTRKTKLDQLQYPFRAGFFGTVLFGALTILSSCQSVPLKGGVNDQGEKVYLTPADEIPKAIDTFSKIQDLTNEESKINYLIQRVQKSKFPFVRNGASYTSAEAAEFLRWKLNRPRWRPLVNTAEDFVNVITKGSVTSGLPYAIVFPNGERRELKAILTNELDFLNQRLSEKSGSAPKQ